MTPTVHLTREQLEALALNPYHHEYPAWCLTCGGRWAVYRAAEAPFCEIHKAAACIHTEFSPTCSADLIRVGQPVPYGESAPLLLEEHADSPFSESR